MIKSLHPHLTHIREASAEINRDAAGCPQRSNATQTDIALDQQQRLTISIHEALLQVTLILFEDRVDIGRAANFRRLPFSLTGLGKIVGYVGWDDTAFLKLADRVHHQLECTARNGE